VELLQEQAVQERDRDRDGHEGGLFPKPREIQMSCSCPDWAGMCKHVAAVMYGVGARLDHQPELFFLLRKVDHLELIEESRLERRQAAREDEEEDARPGGRGRRVRIEFAEPEGTAAAPDSPEAAAKPKRGKGSKTKPAAKTATPAKKKPASKAGRTTRGKKKEGEAGA